MPEQADEEDEEAKAADLDALLELFREEEEPPRKKIPGSVWIFLALVLAMIAIWLAARVATGQLVAKSEPGAMGPTKAGDREARPRQEFTGSVVDDYIARCKRGMTAQEVRWIVEDFQKAGLDHGPGSLSERISKIVVPAYDAPPRGAKGLPALSVEAKASLISLLRDLGQRQRAWYGSTLADGLRLNREQQSLVSDRLRDLMEGDLDRFKEDWGTYESETGVSGALPFYLLGIENFLGDAVSRTWLAREAYAPWVLCNLPDDQKRITWYFYVMDRRSGEPSAWYDPELPWWDPELCSYSDPEADQGWLIGDFPTGDAPDKVTGAGTIFPFLSSQDFTETPGGSAGPIDVQALHCHPAQLKTALLVNPEIVPSLIERLDAGDK